MLVSRNAIRHNVAASPHVCLSCRLSAQQRRHHSQHAGSNEPVGPSGTLSTYSESPREDGKARSHTTNTRGQLSHQSGANDSSIQARRVIDYTSAGINRTQTIVSPKGTTPLIRLLRTLGNDGPDVMRRATVSEAAPSSAVEKQVSQYPFAEVYLSKIRSPSNLHQSWLQMSPTEKWRFETLQAHPLTAAYFSENPHESSMLQSWLRLDGAGRDGFEALLDAHLGKESGNGAWHHSATPVAGQHASTQRSESGASDGPRLKIRRLIDRSRSRSLDSPQSRIRRMPLSRRSACTLHWNNAQRGTPAVRTYHSSAIGLQQTANVALEPSKPPFPGSEDLSGIRAELRRWQETHGDKDVSAAEQVLFRDDDDEDGLSNNLTRLGDGATFGGKADQQEAEREAIEHFSRADVEELENEPSDPRRMRMGDLVEIEFPRSEQESMIAVFVRQVGLLSQFVTSQGRWLHIKLKNVQFTVPGWISPELVEPLLQHLPDEEQAMDPEALKNESVVVDLSIPRHISAPLVSRMLAFQQESMEIYRKNASILDDAHSILAHDTDLRYGSLTSVATTLLNTTADKLTIPAVFTVRKALMQAGFAFNIDRRSHRVTGYLQIRSKAQVQMVHQVRNWLREWQDDLATLSRLNERQKEKFKLKKGTRILQSFIEKSKDIIAKSRETRDTTPFGNVGPSKIRRAITPEESSVKITTEAQFTEDESEVVRFIESWACNNIFVALPRMQALPPLILLATGMYEGQVFGAPTGVTFLQELGTIMPYENRVRFDQHLLLPSSQHSRPLQSLMTQLLHMAEKPNFSDVMKEMRHDWGTMPVFCIDDASAHEIDDGISVERANHADSGDPQWWVHIHIANPTAFFDRDHPLAKMARHMGESIYMPERAYMMLPRWASQGHFSLAQGKPCLTFSARMNEGGEVLEKKVQPGIVRNVIRLTRDEVNKLVGAVVTTKSDEIRLTVGGDPPPPRPRKDHSSQVKPSGVESLKVLQRLAGQRSEFRRAAGGVFFDNRKPEVNVWQSWKTPGLSWDHPHRKGSRIVEGDPVLQLRTHKMVNWFSAGNGDVAGVLVQEMMLLACELASSWCAERKIPIIYRGSVAKPGTTDSATFYREVCEPAMQKNNGEMPLHIGIQYIRTQGSVILATQPLKHELLGLNHYGKVTSPLRRYGDMILHWQIEAALREEARTGRSLVTQNPDAKREFLPFSLQALKTIAVGLQPRESMIQKAKTYAEQFWTAMLVFRAHHFGECKMPFETCRANVIDVPYKGRADHSVMLEDLNISASMTRPDFHGLGEAKHGDVWECRISMVDVYARVIWLKPLRLVERWED